ncbi:protein of unknown function [Candidatus Nitrotoga arctica]|uniref:Uncharacterized protein n=1 Tax=Candidatus Nitrotoga arctica TaxID=453162 RepID=A0ABM8YWJ6_9PROT|nr:protein of unknown function [Candidatus Nitrotoga arctica]
MVGVRIFVYGHMAGNCCIARSYGDRTESVIPKLIDGLLADYKKSEDLVVCL